MKTNTQASKGKDMKIALRVLVDKDFLKRHKKYY